MAVEEKRSEAEQSIAVSVEGGGKVKLKGDAKKKRRHKRHPEAGEVGAGEDADAKHKGGDGNRHDGDGSGKLGGLGQAWGNQHENHEAVGGRNHGRKHKRGSETEAKSGKDSKSGKKCQGKRSKVKGAKGAKGSWDAARPTSSPTIRFDDKPRIRMTIPSALSLRDFRSETEAALEVLEDTTEEVARDGLDADTQCNHD